MYQKLKYLKLPEILQMNDGTPVTAENLPERQKEILDILQENLFGYFPEKKASIVSSQIVHKEDLYDETVDLSVVTITLAFPTGDYSIEFPLFVPKGVENPPCIINLAAPYGAPRFSNPPKYVFDRGIAVAYAPVAAHASDDNDFTQGICKHIYPEGRKGTDGGKLLIWGMICSFIADYIESTGKFDMKNLSVSGCSRNGKGALAAGLYDKRFQFIDSVCAGCGGTAILRGKVGETVKSIMNYAPFWFADKFKDYSDREEDLPFDAHFIIAALAPRKVLLTGAIEDFWCDPYAEMIACVAAGKTYEILGLPGFIYEGPCPVPGYRYPVPGDFFKDGSIGFSLRTGGHGFPDYDWERIADFLVAHKN